MSIFIEKVRIKNFRSLKDVSVDLAAITVLVGANNSGKTSFLRALSLAFNGDRRFWSQDDLFVGKNGKALPKKERIITIDVKIIPANGVQEFDDDWAFVFSDEANVDSEGNNFFAFRTQINYSNTRKEAKIRRYIINDWESETATEDDVIADMNFIPIYFIDAQRDLEDDLKFRTSNVGKLVGEIQYDDKKQLEIESLLKDLNDEAVDSSEVLKHLKTSLEELNQTVQTRGEGVEITPFSKKVRDLHKGIKVHFQDGGSDSFSLEYHGMGTRSWASLLALKAKIAWDAKIAINDNDAFFPLLALEEPEAHLHPNAQRQVYRQLTSIEGQKFASTHSPYIAGVADLGELRCFSKVEDVTEISNIYFGYDRQIQLQEEELRKPSGRYLGSDIQSKIKELKDDKRNAERRIKNEVIATRGEILFSKIVILFEGITEEQSLPIFAKEYFGVFPYELGLTFVNVGGKGNYYPYINLLNSLKIKWLILSDSEIETLEEVIKQIKNAEGELGNVYYLPEDDYEAFILKNYESEVRRAIAIYHSENSANTHYENAQLKEWQNKSLVEVETFMSNYKARISSIYTELIVNEQDIDLRIPAILQDLFSRISKELNYPSKWEKYRALLELLNKLIIHKNEATTI